MYAQNLTKIWAKMGQNGHFYAIFIIGISADFAEYSAEYSVFGRSLIRYLMTSISKVCILTICQNGILVI